MSKAPRRPKNESGPAASAAFAHLSGHTDPFAAFASFGSAEVKSAQGSELRPEFAQAFKRMTKRDTTTRVAACASIQTLIEESEDAQVVLAIPEIAGVLKRRHYSRDKHLRRALCKTLEVLFQKGKTVKNKCVPHFGQLLAPWLCLRHDQEVEVRNAANAAWDTVFDSVDREAMALAHCEAKLVAALMVLLDTTVDGIRDEENLPQEEAVSVLDNVLSSVLGVCAALIRKAATAPKLEGAVARLTDQLVGSGMLWKLGEHSLWRVRAAVYEVIAAYLQHSLGSLEAHQHELLVFMQNAFGERDAEVHTALWPAVLLWLKKIPDDWEGVGSVRNLHVTFLQKLCGMLRKTSGIAGSQTTYGSLLPLLALLGDKLFAEGEEKRAVGFIDGFLISLWNGMRSPTLPVSEIPALLAAWAECWVYLASKAATKLPSVEFFVTDHLSYVLRASLVCSYSLPHAAVAERLAPVLAKGPCIPALAPHLLTLWTEIFDDLGAGAQLVKPPPAPAAPAPDAGGKKKKGKEQAQQVRAVYDTTEGDRFTHDTENTLRRLSELLKHARTVGDKAAADNAGYRQEFTVLLGTYLAGLLGSQKGATTDVRSLLVCWATCDWALVPQLAATLYGDVLGAGIRRVLKGEPAGSQGLWAGLGMADLMVLADAYLQQHDAEAVKVLEAAGESTEPEACGALLDGLTAGVGSAYGEALHGVARNVLATCTKRGGDGLPVPSAGGEESSAAAAWFRVLERATGMAADAALLADVLRGCTEFLAGHHSTAALRSLLALARGGAEAGVVVPAGDTVWGAFKDALVAVPAHIAQHVTHLADASAAALDDWSRFVVSTAMPGGAEARREVAAGAEEKVTKLLAAGAGHPPVFAKIYALEALAAHRTLDVPLLDGLWEAAVNALPYVDLSPEEKDLFILERPAWTGGGSVEAGAVGAWCNAVEVAAVLHHEGSFDAAATAAPLALTLHYARLKLLAESAMESEAHAILCGGNIEVVLTADAAAAEGVLRACVHDLDTSASIEFLARALILREAVHLNERLRRVVLCIAVPPSSDRARAVAEMAAAFPTTLVADKEVSGAGVAATNAALTQHVVNWCQSVAEKDEIGEDVSDADAGAALRLCLWVRDHLDTAAAADTLPGLEACALEKLQPEEGVPEAAWGLREKLVIALHLRDNAAEAVPLLAGLLQAYRPANDFAWQPEDVDAAPALPHAAATHGVLANVLHMVSAAGDAVDVGSRALLLSAALDILTSACRESVDDAAQTPNAPTTASLKRLAVDFVRWASPEDLKLLSPSWSAVVMKLFADMVGLLVAEGSDGRGAPLVGDTDAQAPVHFAPAMDIPGVVVALSALLARVDTESGNAAAPTAEGEAEGASTAPSPDADVVLPDDVQALITSIKDLQALLITSSYPQSQVSIRLLFRLQRMIVQRPLLLQAYLSGWACLLRLLEAASYASVDTPLSSLKGAVLEALQEQGLMKPLMDVVGALLILPKAEAVASMDARGVSAFDAPDAHDPLPDHTDIPLNIRDTVLGIVSAGVDEHVAGSSLFLSGFTGLGDAGLAAVHVFSLLMSAVPASPRRWVNDCEGSLKEAFRTFVQRHLSPALIKKELAFVVEKGDGKTTFNPTDELKVRVLPASATVLLEYEYEDCVVSVKMVVPPSFPLEPIQHPALDAQATRAKAGLSVDVWRGWLMQMTAKLLNKSARLWNLVELWQQNLTRHFDGRHEPCPICYQIVNPTTHQLPSLQCSTCNGKYHKLCLFKWFKQSNDSTCPLCRTAWYSGAPGASSNAAAAGN